jgi:hypothetical protein
LSIPFICLSYHNSFPSSYLALLHVKTFPLTSVPFVPSSPSLLCPIFFPPYYSFVHPIIINLPLS